MEELDSIADIVEMEISPSLSSVVKDLFSM